MLGDPYHDWPKSVTDMILHPNTWKAMLTKAKLEDWWNDSTNACDEDVIECGHINHAGTLVAFPRTERVS